MTPTDPIAEGPNVVSGNGHGFAFAVTSIVIGFSWPLFQLAKFSIGHDLYSHIVLIPFVSAFLIWQGTGSRGEKGHGAKIKEIQDLSGPPRGLALCLWALGAISLAAFAVLRMSGSKLMPEDSLALTTLSFILVIGGACCWFLGRTILRSLRFPLCLLLFMVPFPIFVLNQIETWLQYGSALVAHGLFGIAGTTVFVDELTFQLSTITIQVAPECSGIHSSLALLITSVLAGYYFLRSPSRRAILALAVIPLALLRNGFRVFVIGELCVRIGPEMIDSYIHHQGGPIFFVLSLIPFFLLLFLLVRSERRRAG